MLPVSEYFRAAVISTSSLRSSVLKHAKSDGVLSEDFKDRRFDPSVAKIDSRRLIPLLKRQRPRVRRHLKKSYTRFVPETVVKKKRSIDCRGKNGGSYRLRPIVVFDKFANSGLKVDLKARIAELDKCVLQHQLELV
jgi:hypothetical protein